MTVTLDDIRQARARIAGALRHTPVVEAAPAREPLPGRVALKLECLQVTGSFKPRGATNALRSLDPAAAARGLTTASGGNHGLAVAYVGWRAGLPTTIFLPASVPAAKVAKSSEPQGTSIARQLADAPTARRRPLLAAFLRERTRKGLGLDPARSIDPRGIAPT